MIGIFFYKKTVHCFLGHSLLGKQDVGIQVKIFWVVTPCSVAAEPCYLQNTGILAHHYAASQPRRPELGSSPI